MKSFLGKCSSKVTRPNGKDYEILVSNPVFSAQQESCGVMRANYQLESTFSQAKNAFLLLLVGKKYRKMVHGNSQLLAFITHDFHWKFEFCFS